MSVGCSLKVNITQQDIAVINSMLKLGSNNPNFNFNDTIKKVFRGKAQLILDTLQNLSPEELSSGIKLEYFDQTDSNAVIVNPKDLYKGRDDLRTEMYRKFKREIIEAAVYNKNIDAVIDANKNIQIHEGGDSSAPVIYEGDALNWNIIQYKIKCINNIYKATRGNYAGYTFNTIQDLNAELLQALNEFEQLSAHTSLNALENEVFANAMDAYYVLCNFDNILKAFTPFVKPRKGFSKIEVINKYEYSGPNMKLGIQSFDDSSWAGQSADDNTSDLIKIILDYLEEVDENGNSTGNPITTAGFYRLGSAFKAWVRTANFKVLTGIDNDAIAQEQGIKILDAIHSGNAEARFDNTDPTSPFILETVFKRFLQYADSKNVSYGVDRTTFEIDKLRGAVKIFDSKLPKTIKDMLINTMVKMEKVVGISTGMYKNSNGESIVSDKTLAENNVLREWQRLQSKIQAKCRQFRVLNPQYYKSLCAKYGVTFDKNSNRITFFSNDGTKQFTLALNNKYTGFNTFPGIEEALTAIGPATIVNLISDLTGLKIPLNYQRVMADYPGLNIIDMVGNTLGFIILNSEPDSTISSWKDLGDSLTANATFRMSDGSISASWNNSFANEKKFITRISGVSQQTTTVNTFGNKMPSHQLTSNNRRIEGLSARFANKDLYSANIYETNPVFRNLIGSYRIQHGSTVGEPEIRVEANLNGKQKLVRDLKENELYYISFISNFWNSIPNGKILLQNVTFSDKNTHFLIPYNLKFVIYQNEGEDAVTLEDALYLLRQNDSESITAGEKAFMRATFEARRNTYKGILDFVYNDYAKVFGYAQDNPSDSEKFRRIKTSLSAYLVNGKIDEKALRDTFGSISLTPELHYTKAGFNEVLESNINQYVLEELPEDALYSKSFEDRLKEQKRFFLKDIIDSGFTVNRETTPGLDDSLSGWFDEADGDMLLYKGDINGEFQLNPMLNAYFYSDVLLSNSYNEIVLGQTFYHPNKAKLQDGDIIGKDEFGFPIYSEKYLRNAESSRLLTSYKRTVALGATTHTFMPRKYGVGTEIEYAVVQDMPAWVWNILGHKQTIDSMDGSGFESPYQGELENMSLLDAHVGSDKKTIQANTDPRNGRSELIKWAVDEITNARRRESRGSKIRFNDLFTRMHSKTCRTFDLSQYYIPEAEHVIRGKNAIIDRDYDMPVTYMKNAYVNDFNTGKDYLIGNIQYDSSTKMTTWDWIPVDDRGNILSEEEVIHKGPQKIDTIAKMDELFGGCDSKSFDPTTGKLKYGRANIEIVSKIICHKKLKNKMISYVINNSAIKNGYTNINPAEALWRNDLELKTTSTTLSFGGLQMNADHHIEDSDVTEMSQMISALIQNGYLSKEAFEIYSTIGDVVLESMGKQINIAKTGDYERIKQEVGKLFIDSFSHGEKDTIGLAQAFLVRAEQTLRANKVVGDIPFSDPQLYPSFVATILSDINKSGIRRHFAGFAGVLIASRGIMQHYNAGAGLSGSFREVNVKLHKNGYAHSLPEYIDNKGIYSNGNFLWGEDQKAVLDTFNSTPILEGRESITFGDPSNAATVTYLRTMDGTSYNGEVFVDFTYTTDVSKLKSQILSYVNAGYKITGNNQALLNYVCRDLMQLSDSMYQNVQINPFIKQINRRDIEEGDVIISVDEYGDTKTYECDNIDDIDFLRNLDDRNVTYYKWHCKPKDLRQGEQYFTVGGVTYSLYDTDAVRATHYLRQLEKESKSRRGVINLYEISDSRVIVINEALKHYSGNKTLLTESDLPAIRDYLRSEINELARKIDAKESISYQTVFGDADLNAKYKVESNYCRPAEIITGRINGEQLLLEEGDTIADIEELKEKFWENKLQSRYALGNDGFDKTKYEAVLIGDNGEKIYVALRNYHNTRELLDHFTKADRDFETREGSIYYNDDFLCPVGTKEFFQMGTEARPINLMVVDSLDELNDILDHSSCFKDLLYNYTEDVMNPADVNAVNAAKFKEIFVHQFADKIDEEGYLTEDIYKGTQFGKQGHNINREGYFSKLSGVSAYELNEANKESKNRKIVNRAKRYYKAFQAYTNAVGARIPTQSMQSFMGMKVVMWSDTDTNEIYVPAVQTWLQGSDYDITI